MVIKREYDYSLSELIHKVQSLHQPPIVDLHKPSYQNTLPHTKMQTRKKLIIRTQTDQRIQMLPKIYTSSAIHSH